MNGNAIAKLFVSIGADTSGVNKGLQQTENALSGSAGRMGGMAKLAGAAVVAGLAAAAVAVGKFMLDSVQVAAEFESTLNSLKAVSGATGAEMAQLSKAAMDLGADLTLPATSANDAAQAMLELSKAGLSVTDTLNAAKGTLQLAAAAQVSEAQAAEIAANALNAFHLAGSDAVRVADLLAASANASSGEITDMADALKMSSAVYAAAGVSIETLVAMIGQMANAGIQGSDAGTSLKQMLLSLQAPSDKAAGLMEELGIKIYDASGNMFSMENIIGQFASKLGVLSQEQRNAALATIFGSDAVRAANIILLSGVDAHTKMVDAVSKQGAAAELAAAKTKGLAGAWEGLMSQLETVMLIVGTPFLGVLEEGVRGLAEALQALQSGGIGENGFTVWLGQVGEAINLAAGQINAALLPALQALAPLWDEFARVVGPLVTQVLAALGNEIVEHTIPNFTNLVVQFLKAIPPTVEFAKVVGGQLNEAFRQARILWEGLVKGFQDALRFIEQVKLTLTDLANTIMTTVKAAFDFFQTNIIAPTVQALAALKSYISEVIAAIRSLVNAIGSIPGGIGGAVNDAAGWVNNNLPGGGGGQFMGERFGGGAGGGRMRGGMQINLTYAPVVSLMDEAEAETKLSPFVRAAVRAAMGT